MESNNRATLVNPSVINGAQTLYAISASGEKNSPALVTTRVVVRGESRGPRDNAWLLELIRSVNSQNKVQEADLRSNEPEQVFLQTKFREFGVYYERKRGEWKEVRNEPRHKNFARLSLRSLGQALMSTAHEDGHGIRVVKSGTDRVFADTNYRRIFGSRAAIGYRFKKIYFVYRLMRLLDAKGYGNRSTARTQQHAYWNVLWLLHRGANQGMEWRRVSAPSLKTVFDELETGNTMRARSARKTLRSVTVEVWRAYKRFSRKDPDKWSPNNFFKTTPGIESLVTVVLPRITKRLRSLGDAIST